MELPSALSRPSLKKKNSTPKIISFISGKWNFLPLRVKTFLYFLKNNFSQSFRPLPPKILIFWEIELFKKTSYTSGDNFLIYGEMETLKSFLYFRK